MPLPAKLFSACIAAALPQAKKQENGGTLRGFGQGDILAAALLWRPLC
jgi:hypothetical protein